MAKYVDEVLDLAIPHRETYNQACLPRNPETPNAYRKFGVFEGQRPSEYAPDPGEHTASITPMPKYKPEQQPDGTFRKILVGHEYKVTCSCKWQSGRGSVNEVFEQQYAEHVAMNNTPESPIPPDSFYVDESDAHLVASYTQTVDGVRYHAPAIDIDWPVHARESSKGKAHLFIDKQMTQEEYWKLLDVMSEVGLVEPGYVLASKRRHASYLRLPDVTKARPAEETLRIRKEVLNDPSKSLREALTEFDKKNSLDQIHNF